jgi:hypothetical protein
VSHDHSGRSLAEQAHELGVIAPDRDPEPTFSIAVELVFRGTESRANELASGIVRNALLEPAVSVAGFVVTAR